MNNGRSIICFYLFGWFIYLTINVAKKTLCKISGSQPINLLRLYYLKVFQHYATTHQKIEYKQSEERIIEWQIVS